MSELSQQMMRDAAQRLHHIGMRYVGALAEVAKGKPVGFLPADAPGVHEMRDLIDLMLLTRAELNGLTTLLLEARVFTPEKVQDTFAEEYDWFANKKAKQFGVEIFEGGLRFTSPK